MKKIIAILCFSALFASATASASPASDGLLAGYKAAGAKPDAAKGKADWSKQSKGEDGEMLACSSCHGTDLSKTGEHHKTHKIIQPMSPRANAERFTDEKKVEKWFKRNCKDVLGRECTVQEKADFLTFLLAQ